MVAPVEVTKGEGGARGWYAGAWRRLLVLENFFLKLFVGIPFTEWCGLEAPRMGFYV